MNNGQKMLYTGYFSKVKDYVKDGLFPVSIARGTPNFVGKIAQYELLAPSWDLVKLYKNTKDEVLYREKYKEEVLDKTTPQEVYNNLIALSSGKTPVLLCWESSEKFCHRHLVAEWLANEYTIKESEL